MIHMVRVLVCAVVLGMAGSQAIADVNMQEGSWETAVEMKMEGLPFAMPPMIYKMTQCLTKKDMVPNTAGKDQKCEVKDQRILGNKVTWKVVCIDKEGTMEGQGEILYGGNAYQGTIKTKTTSKKGETMNSTMKLSGRRLGNCTK